MSSRWSSADEVSKIFGGKVLKSVTGLEVGSDEVIFEFEDGAFRMYHSQDCCESVDIEDVCGYHTDLSGATFMEIIEKDSGDRPPLYEHEESYTWTFYTIVTSKGYIDVRWYGSSNGYYSEGVDFSYNLNKGENNE